MVEKSPEIFKLISKIMDDIGPIKKDNTNKFQGYKFRGIDDVYKAVNPVFVKHGVFCVPIVEETIREEHKTKKGDPIYFTVIRVQYKFYAPDGSCVSAAVIGEGMDSSDKSANKAMSAAFKMAFFQVFCIPTEEGSVDSEKDSHESQGRQSPYTLEVMLLRIPNFAHVMEAENWKKKHAKDINILCGDDKTKVADAWHLRVNELKKEVANV